MARYDSGHKAATRQRIIETASRRIKQDGIDGSGIATLMADAGLTNGAFYAHFESKEDLVAHIVAEELRLQAERLRALEPGPKSLQVFIREYISLEHRDTPSAGCPSAALLDEIGRCSPATRSSYSAGAEAIVEAISTHLSPTRPQAARDRAIGLFALLVGTLQLARAVSDEKLSAEVLESGLNNALSFIS
jgi:TetR/AcrR family transcriptional regulator, transcriptional repressor for nem operon